MQHLLFLRYKLQRTELFVVLGNFLPFHPPNNPKKLKFWKTKPPRDIIILHLCTTNENHMMYGSWDIKCNRQNKMKKSMEISFYTSVPKIMIISYTVPEIPCVADVIVFILGYTFLFLPTWQPKKWKLQKNEKRKAWRYHYFTQVYHKSWSYALMFLRSGTWWM